MEDWPFVDDRDLISFRGMQSCTTCHHFGYVTLSHAKSLVDATSSKDYCPLVLTL